jgi:hypothetical protein
MLRQILFASLSAIAALCASACSYSSAVDVAPYKSRSSQAVLADGDYCEAAGQWAPFTVNSSRDCVPVKWSGATRTYAVSIDEDDASETVDAAIAPLGAGLYAAQIDVDDGPAPHQIHLFVARGDAFAMLNILDDKELKAVTARHPKVTFGADRSGRPYVAAGKLSRVKAFLRDVAREALIIDNREGEALSVGVRDMGGMPDHPATRRQTEDIEAVLKAAKKLTAG